MQHRAPIIVVWGGNDMHEPQIKAVKQKVLEGKAYWSNIHEPDSEYFNPTYRLNLTISPEKSAKLASEGVKIQRLDYKTHDQYFFMLQKKACYGDIDYPAPAVYDKEGNKFELDDRFWKFFE